MKGRMAQRRPLLIRNAPLVLKDAYLSDGARVFSSTAELSAGMRIDICMQDGSVRAEIIGQNTAEASDGR